MGATPSTSVVDKQAYGKLVGNKVHRSLDGELVDITTLWNQNERAVVAFGRSFG